MTQRRDSPKGQVLLGCDFVAHRLRSTVTTPASSLLVSLQNHLWQIVSFIVRQTLIPLLLIFILATVSLASEDIESLFLKGSCREAIQKYGTDKSLSPSEKYLLALCYRESGDVKKAEDIWQKLLSGPEKERSLLALAFLKNKEGSLNEGEKLFRQFLREFPESGYYPAGLLGLSEVLLQKKKTKERLDILSQLRRQYPLSLEAEKASAVLGRELGPYTIQVGSFVDLDRAKKLAEELALDGYDVYLLRSAADSVIYKVRIGNFNDRKKAENAGQILKKEKGLNFFITR